MKIFSRVLLACAAIFATAAALSPVVNAVMSRAEKVAVDSPKLLRSLGGTNSVFAVLGGFRPLLADFVWIKAYVEWERRNLTECMADLSLSVLIDPACISYWKQAASIIAFDMPHWIMEASDKPYSQEEKKSLRRRQALRALKFLQPALQAYPQNPVLQTEVGKINIVILEDFKAAEDAYKKTAQIYGADCPVYILRILAALQARNGKFSSAVKTLESVLAKLESDSPIKAEILSQIQKAKALAENANK